MVNAIQAPALIYKTARLNLSSYHPQHPPTAHHTTIAIPNCAVASSKPHAEKSTGIPAGPGCGTPWGTPGTCPRTLGPVRGGEPTGGYPLCTYALGACGARGAAGA